MPIKWLIIMAAVWIVGSIIGGTMSGTWFAGSETSTLNAVLTFQAFEIHQLWGIIPLPIPNMEWFGAIGDMIIWDFDIFEGEWALVRYIVLLPVSFGVGLGLILQVIQIVRG